MEFAKVFQCFGLGTLKLAMKNQMEFAKVFQCKAWAHLN